MANELLKPAGAARSRKVRSNTGGVPETVIDRAGIKEILGPIYREEMILTQSVTCVGDGNYSSEFLFPEYRKTNNSLGHVSANQISEALIEAIYTALALDIRFGRFPLVVPPGWFHEVAMELILFRTTILYREELHCSQPAHIATTLSEVGERKLRRRFLSLTCTFSGAIRGEAETLLDFQRVPQI